jgi:hypothetical protein
MCVAMQLLQLHIVEQHLPLAYINLAVSDPIDGANGLHLQSAAGNDLTVTLNKKDILYISAEGMAQASRVVQTDVETCIGVMHIVTTPLVPNTYRDEERPHSPSRAERAGEPAEDGQEVDRQPALEASAQQTTNPASGAPVFLVYFGRSNFC